MKQGKLRKLFTSIQTKYIKKDNPRITRQSDSRALRVLLSKRATRHDIQQLTGHINAPDDILNLRRNGWGIDTIRIYYRNDQGVLTWRGQYRLSDDHARYAIDNKIVENNLIRESGFDNDHQKSKKDDQIKAERR